MGAAFAAAARGRSVRVEGQRLEDMLLNWRGAPFTYRYVSFSDIYNDFQSKTRQRPQDEFKGKVVLIGSTAPSLFDVKPTSMARQFPGVEILATAIDNLQHDDYIRVPESPYSGAGRRAADPVGGRRWASTAISSRSGSSACSRFRRSACW
jgi:hypothetical protein